MIKKYYHENRLSLRCAKNQFFFKFDHQEFTSFEWRKGWDSKFEITKFEMLFRSGQITQVQNYSNAIIVRTIQQQIEGIFTHFLLG